MQQTLERIDRVVARLAEGAPWRSCLALALLMLAVLVPMQSSIPPIDRDEVFFAQASRQMAESGDWIDIRFAEGTRYKKPIGIYWLQAVSAKVLGGDELGRMWLYRLPSLLAAIGAVLATYAVGLTLFDRRRAFLGALLIGGTLVLAGEARLAKTDAALLLSIVSAQWALARAWMSDVRLGGFWVAMFAVMLGASMLIKGPIGLMVVGLTAAALSLAARDVRWLGRLRPVASLTIFAVVVLPWYIAITVTAGMAFWDEALGRDLLGKVASGQESHGAPPGSYLAALWLTFWPAAIVLPAALLPVWRGKSQRAVLFLLAWLVPSWIVFELVATKLVHYVMPMYPALAMLVAYGWDARTRAGFGPVWLGAMAALAALGLIYATIPLVYSMTIGFGGSLIYYAGFLLVAFTLYAVFQALRARMTFAPVALFPVLCLGVALSLFGHLSRVDYLWPARVIAGVETDCPVRVVGFSEPSLVFTTGDWTIDDGLETIEGDCALIFAEARVLEKTQQALMASGWRLDAGTPIEGMDLGKGRPITLTPITANRGESP